MRQASNSSSKPYAKEGYALIGAAFEAHTESGGGLLEEIYQENLEIELEHRGFHQCQRVSQGSIRERNCIQPQRGGSQ